MRMMSQNYMPLWGLTLVALASNACYPSLDADTASTYDSDTESTSTTDPTDATSATEIATTGTTETAGSDTGTASSSTDTGPGPACGNGVVEGREACDDGNDDNTDECVEECVDAKCGDGFTQAGVEECDDGAENGDYDKCASDCSGPGPRCGDGEMQTIEDEECDNGVDNQDPVSYGGCSKDCKQGPRCGDGEVQVEEEICDDGDLLGDDYDCSEDCKDVNPRLVFVTSKTFKGDL